MSVQPESDAPPPSSTEVQAAFSLRVDRLVREHFSDPARTLFLKDGEVLLREGAPNDRLYYVISGQLVGVSSEEKGTELLCVGPGEFAGLHSFASPDPSAMTIHSDGESTVCYARLADFGGSDLTPEQVLMPIFSRAMLTRQKSAYRLRMAEQERERRFREMQAFSQLGQFSAGVAHELNNAISVIDRGSEWLARALSRQIKQTVPESDFAVFEIGLHTGRCVASRDARQAAKALRSQYKLSPAAALEVAQMGLPPEMLDSLSESLDSKAKALHELWELGATFHDLTVAAEQAAGVVESMKHLGGRGGIAAAPVNVHDTIAIALTIMRSVMSGVKLRRSYVKDPPFVHLNKGELVQVWVNLIHNACDAMPDRAKSDQELGEAGRPELFILTSTNHDQLSVRFRDTGAGIAPELLDKIFQPNFSTKKSGLSFGLGIGLSIVRRIVSSAGGTITASNWERGAEMTVLLPLALPMTQSEFPTMNSNKKPPP